MITILCAGSRGDFQPYIALAQQLIKLGKEVRIAGNREFSEFVRSYNIDYFALDIDYKSIGVDPKLLEEAGSADNPLKMLLTFNKMKNYGIYTTKEYYKACKDSELIIYHPGCTIGYFAANEMRIPSVLASPFPIHKTKEYLSVVMYGKSKQSSMNLNISYKMLQGMLWMASKTSLKSFWKKQFGKLPNNFKAPFEMLSPSKPAIISCSNHIFKRPSDWDANIHQYGYFVVEEADDYTPDPKLIEFINAGEKPVYIGFGSMSMMKHHDKIREIVIEALRKSGRRAIISGFGQPCDLPQSVYAIDGAPHTWLFKHVSAVCHHGGAGTSAAGFSAGVPSIIIPFSNDQFAWAHRSHDLGIGVEPLYMKHLNVVDLISRIEQAYKPDIQAKAKVIGEQIRQENGAFDSAKVIVELLDNV